VSYERRIAVKSAVKTLDFKKRQRDTFEDWDSHSDDDENENSPDNIKYEEYKNDGRLKSIIDNIPGKNIVFSSDNIKNVLKVCDGVRTNINNKSAATITVVMLSEHTYYSQLSTNRVCSTMAWYKRQNENETGQKNRSIF
jgi:hypothetical protein